MDQFVPVKEEDEFSPWITAHPRLNPDSNLYINRDAILAFEVADDGTHSSIICMGVVFNVSGDAYPVVVEGKIEIGAVDQVPKHGEPVLPNPTKKFSQDN